MNRHENEQLIIAGPCAAESRKQVLHTVQELRERSIPIMRASLWKPRTQPGFDGVGEKGLPWLAEAVQAGIIPATEVLVPSHAEKTAQTLLVDGKAGELILWIGARNQNHFTQREIAQSVNDPRVRLLIKNQLWPDRKHWVGIVNHVTQAGFPKERIILCHRGFVPNGTYNPQNLRNIPDWEMAKSVQEETELPMLMDPSHIGGTPENVLWAIKEALKWDFDGFMIEVHHNPQNAQTDAKQQLTWDQFDEVLQVMRDNKNTIVAKGERVA